ncbi:MAG: histidine phosphatase family protein [Propionibacteriaceae bacterium]
MPNTEVHCDVLFIRHGHAHTGGLEYGSDDVSRLSTEGHQQAQEMAEQIALWRPDCIYASPFRRTIETAEHVRAAVGEIPLIPWDGLRERHFHCFEGLTYEGVAQHFGDQAAALLSRSEHLEIDGEESMAAAVDRVVEAVRGIVTQSAGKKIVIVSHGGPYSWLMCRLLGVDLDRLRLFHLDPAHGALLRLHASESSMELLEFLGANLRNLPASEVKSGC